MPTRPDPKISWIILLGSLTALGPLSIDMYLPAFPDIEHSLSAASGTAQFTLATYFVGLALGQALYGPFSDRFGRKRPLLFGMALYALASVGCAFSGSIGMLACFRFLQALGGCAGMVIPRAIVRDHFEAQGSARIFSLLLLVMGLAPILAPLLGSWIVSYASWRTIFWILTAFSAASIVAVTFRLEETLDTRNAAPLNLRNIIGTYVDLLRDHHYLGHVLTGGLAQAGMFAYITGSPFVLIDLFHLTPAQFSLAFGSNAAGYILGAQINARLLRKYALPQLLQIASYIPAGFALCLLIMSLTGWGGLPALLAGLFGFIASLGFIGPNAMAGALAHQGHRAGMASALMGTLQFGTATLASSVIGLLHVHSSLPMTGVMAACGFGSLIAHRLLVKNAA